MGRLSALDMAANTDLDTALSWHLSANHFPPLPPELLPVAKRAIAKASADQWDDELKLPAGIRYRDASSAPVYACVEAWHLDAFIELEEEE